MNISCIHHLRLGRVPVCAAFLLLTLMLLSPAPALHAAPAEAPAPQVPNTLNYQGTLRDAQGNLVTGTRTMSFGIYDAVLDGNLLHAEEVSDISVRDGIFNVVLGDGATLSSSVFASGPRFIGITVAPDPNEMVPRQRLHPVPWAAQATTAIQATNAANATNATNAGTATTLVANATINSVRVNPGNLTVGAHNHDGAYKLDVDGRIIARSDIWTSGALTAQNIDSLGNLSIGYGSPGQAARSSYALDVAGNTHMRGELTVSQQAVVHGKVTAGGGFNGRCGPTPGAVNLIVTCNSDVAETFGTDERTEPGDLVVFIPQDRNFPAVQLSTQPYEGTIVGVVSTDPGLVFDQGETHLAGDITNLITDEKTVVAMVGRVPTKFSLENGPIAVGDPLTSSSTPGIAMKATQAGRIIGYAMQSSDAAEDGKLLVWLQLSTHIPQEQLTLLNSGAASTSQSNQWPWGLPLFGGLVVIGAVYSTRNRL